MLTDPHRPINIHEDRIAILLVQADVCVVRRSIVLDSWSRGLLNRSHKRDKIEKTRDISIKLLQTIIDVYKLRVRLLSKRYRAVRMRNESTEYVVLVSLVSR